MKPTVYLDTTISSYFFDERENLKLHIDATKKWWNEERENFDILISEETIAEITDGEYPRKTEIVQFISEIQILPYEPQIIEIAQIYLENYLMPRVLKGDALHLAYASFYKIDFLLTWNCNHLANANKRKHIRVINTRLNLAIPDIITPLELFSETTDDDE
jgi:predicted nucleic acid-binding protein